MRLRRRLTLSHGDRPFLERWGFVWDRLGGFYLHQIADADPGIDVHDHPWSFVSIILRGGYTEELAEDLRRPTRTVWRTCPRFSVHRLGLGEAHRITHSAPNTWTLVFRGPTRRTWGFYTPEGWVDWRDYDYETRRPLTSRDNRTP